jgi:hypothetical protein
MRLCVDVAVWLCVAAVWLCVDAAVWRCGCVAYGLTQRGGVTSGVKKWRDKRAVAREKWRGKWRENWRKKWREKWREKARDKRVKFCAYCFTT